MYYCVYASNVFLSRSTQIVFRMKLKNKNKITFKNQLAIFFARLSKKEIFFISRANLPTPIVSNCNLLENRPKLKQFQNKKNNEQRRWKIECFVIFYHNIGMISECCEYKMDASFLIYFNNKSSRIRFRVFGPNLSIEYSTLRSSQWQIHIRQSSSLSSRFSCISFISQASEFFTMLLQ